MKRITALIIAIFLCVLLCACGGISDSSDGKTENVSKPTESIEPSKPLGPAYTPELLFSLSALEGSYFVDGLSER